MQTISSMLTMMWEGVRHIASEISRAVSGADGGAEALAASEEEDPQAKHASGPLFYNRGSLSSGGEPRESDLEGPPAEKSGSADTAELIVAEEGRAGNIAHAVLYLRDPQVHEISNSHELSTRDLGLDRP